LTRRRRRRAAWSCYRGVAGRYLYTNGEIGVNPDGAQCVNVLNTYWASLGIPSRFGNAGDWVGRPTRYLRWLPSTPGVRVVAGDAACISASGAYPNGHVALVLDGSETPLVVMGQNSPTGTPCQLAGMNPYEIAGYLRPV
jgi:hypothetical protein